MTLAQWTLDTDLRLQRSGGGWRVARATIRAARRLQITLGDPNVTYRIGRVALKMPLSHQLPYYRTTYPQYSSNIGRIASAVQQKYPDLTMVDIGANIGDTVAIVRVETEIPILSIEGAPAYLALLNENLRTLRDVEIEAAFLDSSPGPLSASLRMSDGTGHLALREEPEAELSVTTLDDVLLRHPRFASSKLTKSDTDGMDCQILSGARRHLMEARPVLFFEYDPDLTARAGADASAVFDLLDATGYRHVLVYENTGDLLLLLDLHDKRLTGDLNAFFSGHNGRRYADLCAFHATDTDLALELHESELTYFAKLRRMA